MACLKTLIRSADQVKKFESYFEKLPIDRHTTHSLDIQRNEMERLWNDFKGHYEDVLDKIDDSKDKSDVQSVEACYFATYESHLRGLARVNELLETLTQKSKRNKDACEDPSDQTAHISVPPCDTEIFHGDYKSWPTFRDMFTALYRNNKRLSSVEKMCHLLKKTQGEARDLLKTCPITNDGFEMAWQNLVNRYENKRVLVNAQLKCLFNISPITKETGPNIRRLQRTINDCITNLSLLKIDTKSWDIIFVYICSTCLPDITLSMWEHSIPHTSNLPTWRELDDFLTSRFQTLESVADIRSTFSSQHSSNFNKAPIARRTNPTQERKVNSYNTNVSNDKSGKCLMCSHNHPLRLCPTFLRMSIDERFTVVKKQKRCTNCLGTSHDLKRCKSRFVCNTCQRKHHSLLHRPASSTSSNQQRSASPNSPPVVSTLARENNSQLYNPPKINTTPFTTSDSTDHTLQTFSTQLQSTSHSVILGTALVDVYKDDIKYTVRALIDSASEATFVSKRLQMKLNLQTHSSQAEIYGLSGSLTATSVHTCRLQIGSPIDKKFKIYTDAFIVRKLTGQLSHYPLSSLRDNPFAHLQMADKDRNADSEIELLLGGDIYPKIIRDGLEWDQNQLLVAQKTVFGWIVTGRIESENHSNTYKSFFNEITLSNQIQRFWELENIPQKRQSSPEDAYCENLYTTTTFRNNEGRFVVSLPFKPEHPESLNVSASRKIAISQFLRNETRLSKNQQLKAEYDRVITEYSTLGQMTKVNPPSNEIGTYYLPHHAVTKPDSTTTKLRVVFNASSPSTNGTSLNDILYPGPVLQADLTILLLRWRFFRYVYNADIEKMYRQILVTPAHTPYQRIIFRSSPEETLGDFELNTVTFGVNCAPYLAIRTLQQLASECESKYPHVSDILKNYMYVDDVLAGAHTLSTALKSRDDLITILQSAGFSLRKWTANNDFLLKNLPTDHLLGEEFVKLSDSSLAKTLGLRWNAGCDYFYFKLKNAPDKRQTTKRKSMSYVNRWQRLKILHQNLARRWKEEYLRELHKRTKWKYPQRDYAVDDLVVIRQENLPPNQWRLGRITKIFPGSDQRVRVVEVRTANGVVTRPISKLVLLPNSSQQCLYIPSSLFSTIANMSHHRRARSPIVQRRSTIRSISTNKPINYDCRLCKQNHALRKCVRFNKMNVSERRQLVQLFKYCENCLAHSHLLPNCRVQSRCRHCGAKHHTLLHCHERLTTSTGFEVPTASFGTVIPTVILKVNLNRAWQSVRGLLNPCAEFSAIAQFLVQRFEVPCERVGDDEWCTISFRSRFDEGPTFKVTAKVTKDLPTLLGRKRLEDRLADGFTHLRLADPEFYLDGELNLVLGADIYPQLIRNGVQPQSVGMAMAQDTMLGWTIIGRIGA